MKNIKFLSFIFILLVTVFIFVQADTQDSLENLYKGGKVRFFQELVLDDDSMPEEVLFESPVHITNDANGNIYICDYRANDIKKFDASGKFIKIIGREGQGPGEFSWPFQATCAKEKLFVWDMRNRRLCALTLDGEYITAKKITSDTGRPQKMRSLPDGDVIIGMEKTFFAEQDRPQEYTIDVFSPDLEHKKTVFSHEIWRNKYLRGDFGMTNVPQPFAPLVYWDVLPDGKVAVGFSKRYEIGIYDCEKGKLSTFTHPYKPIRVTEQDKKAHFAGMTFSSGGVTVDKIPDLLVKNTKFPKSKPAFNGILVDSQGNILVHAYRKNRDEMARYFDSFDSEGNFIANVQVIGDVSFPTSPWISFVGRSFWRTKTGEDELIKVVKYKISE
jgi:hypothetical protein